MSNRLANNSGVRNIETTHKPIVILRCKVVVVGDACVGKTALTQVFNTGGSSYPKNYIMTIGAEFCVKQVKIPNTNVIVELFIFDCAGQSIFNQIEMNAKYWENTSAIMAVFDIGNGDTLQSTSRWIAGVRGLRPSGQKMIGVLVGNKCEYRDGTADSRAEVTREEGASAASDMCLLKYFETSAAENINVEEPFHFIAQEFYDRYEATIARAEDLSGSTM